MTFTVTYREKSGAKTEVEIEAANRAACVAECKARGIAPIAVREGRAASPKSVAHGGAGRAANVSAARRGGIWRAAILAATCLAAGIGAWLWLGREAAQPAPAEKPAKAKAERPKPPPRPAARPRAAPPAPAVTSAPQKEPDIIDRTRDELARVRARMKNASPESLENLRLKEADLEKLLVDKKMQFHMTNIPHVAYQPFKTCTEQVMDWIFNCTVGDDPPPFVPPLDPGEMANIDAILDRANELVEEDTPETADRKQMVALAKKELKSYLAQGGNAADFLHFYHQQLTTAYELRMDASRLVREYSRDATPEETRKFLEATNKELAKKGIAPVMLSDKMKQKIGLPVDEKEVQK